MGSGLADLGRAAPALNQNWQNILNENRAVRQEAVQREELAMRREQFGQQQAISKLQLEREQMALEAQKKQKEFNETLVHYESLPQISQLSGPTKNKLKEDLVGQKIINEQGYGQRQNFREFQKTLTTDSMKPYVDIEVKARHQATSDAQEKLAKELGKGEFRDAKKVEQLQAEYNASLKQEQDIVNGYDAAIKLDVQGKRIGALKDQIMQMEGGPIDRNDPLYSQVMLSLRGGDFDKVEQMLMERLKNDERIKLEQAKPAIEKNVNIHFETDKRTGKRWKIISDPLSGREIRREDTGLMGDMVGDQERKEGAEAAKLRKEFDSLPEVKEYKQVKTKVDAMESVLSKSKGMKNFVGVDQALISLYNKITDPQSVVRESEYARTAENMPIVNAIIGKMDKWRKGGAGLTGEEREALVTIAREIGTTYTARYEETAGRYRQYATQSKFNPEDVVPSAKKKDSLGIR